MFRKLVSDFAYSPSAIEQLGAYAGRLRREQIIRETALVFTIFAGIVLAFAIFAAPVSSGVVATDHAAQTIEHISRSLPQIGNVADLIIFAILLIMSLLLYLRSRQLALEIREIRHEFNIGQITENADNKFSRKSEFAKIMFAVRQNLGFGARLNPRIVHFGPIEIIGEFFANVLLRPVALLVGGVCALIFTAVMYIFVRYYGFALAGSEWLAAFAAGWFIGLVGDWLHEGFANHPDDL